ncbi:siderophore-interacting protein [Rosenbergiella australiborealis]|uniref:Siderophore-interacting protein n=1 Tax=Rosenbergiella australiborealis TaxID=1544696 RepID=A0ABS5T6B8_9GAMM|nr:siderophore-interacting protein [Rosenbergiella australiborealis]MBT0727897.1 siderophore-interacting protein [Rosenbergiella australiborealis]
MSNTLSSGKKIPHRVRNELKFRTLTVSDKQQVAGQFWRVTFQSEALAGFDSPGSDDHIKLFFPETGQRAPILPTISEEGIVWPENQRPESRDYTPLAFDGKGSLTIDFYRHEKGLASEWAEHVAVGDLLTIAGPRGSLVIPGDYAEQLYIFDETGLPAMKRRLSTVSANHIKLIAFADRHVIDAYLGELLGGHELHCIEGDMIDSANIEQVITLTESLSFPTDDYFVWVTGEGKAVKNLSDYFIQQRGCSPELVRAVAYWHGKE